MRSASFLKTSSVFCSLLLLTGCFSILENNIENSIEEESGGQADVDMNRDGSMHVETEEGTMDIGNNKLPSDWPSDVPVYPNATISYSASMNPQTGKPGHALVLLTTDSPEDVMAFYETQLPANGWTLEPSIPGMTLTSGVKGENRVSLIAAGADGQTTITLAVEKAE